MPVLTWADAEILAGPFRLTGRSNNVDLELTAAELIVTTFDSGRWTERIGGLAKMASSVEGFFDAEPTEVGALALDAQLFSELAAAQMPYTIAPTKADGSVAYIAPAKRGTFSLFGPVGEVAPFSSELWGDGQAGRGNLIHPASVVETVTGTGTGVQLGATAAGQNLLVSYHVLTLDGTSPTIDLTVESDDNAGFTTPATVLNTGVISAPAAALTVVGGPIVDDYYRVTWTIAGTTPQVRFAVAVAHTPAPS